MTWEWFLEAAKVVVPALIAYGAFRLSKKKDAVSAQSGVASNHREGTAQVIEGLNGLINQLQEENLKLRASAEDRATRLDAMTLELARWRKKYGLNGENGL